MTLRDAVRSVMQPGGGLDRPRSMTPLGVLSEIHERWPGGWPLCTNVCRARFYAEMTVCTRHKGYYETAYDDYSHLAPWVQIDGPTNG